MLFSIIEELFGSRHFMQATRLAYVLVNIVWGFLNSSILRILMINDFVIKITGTPDLFVEGGVTEASGSALFSAYSKTGVFGVIADKLGRPWMAGKI